MFLILRTSLRGLYLGRGRTVGLPMEEAEPSFQPERQKKGGC